MFFSMMPRGAGGVIWILPETGIMAGAGLAIRPPQVRKR
jgi:hypothetical protein